MYEVFMHFEKLKFSNLSHWMCDNLSVWNLYFQSVFNGYTKISFVWWTRIHKFNYIISFIIHLWNLNTSIRSDYTITWIHKSSFNAVQAETRSTCLGQVVIVGLLRGDHTKLVGGWGWGTWSFLLTPYKGFFTVA